MFRYINNFLSLHQGKIFKNFPKDHTKKTIHQMEPQIPISPALTVTTLILTVIWILNLYKTSQLLIHLAVLNNLALIA